MRRPLLYLSLLATLAATVPARADDTADEAEFRFRQGAALYVHRKYEAALTEFFASNRLVHNKNVRFNIARCFENLGKVNEAFRFYNDLRGENWDAADRKSLDAAIEKLKPRVALVTVRTEPPGADIYLDRKDLGSRGSSPRTLALPPGQAKLLLELDGYRPAVRSVELVVGREALVDVALHRIYGHVALRSEPSGAEVRIDRPDASVACHTPCDAKVLPGSHLLLLTLNGRLPARLSSEVGADKTVSLEARLPPGPPPTGPEDSGGRRRLKAQGRGIVVLAWSSGSCLHHILKPKNHFE